jgi:hypothetical protein
MSNIRPIDMMLIDDLFEMNGGYVLNFSDRTFARFFADELNHDIDNPIYSRNGTSKAKRLRCFLQTADKPMVARALNALWDYREALRQRSAKPEILQNPYGRLQTVIAQLKSEDVPSSNDSRPQQNIDRALIARFQSDLLALAAMAPQPRGYAFETFLKDFFNAFGLEARDAFRLRGEQIDGSFILSGETYLLEAKWQNTPIGNEPLHAFQGKIEQKAAWTRGLFISYGGFSEDGLHAFGRGKRVICMDGLDISDALAREISVNHVLDKKVRRAAETGLSFVRVRELFPH